jgi:prepilin signal peptidase PulO-like enzyme (type II secretory pathway)
MALAGLLVGIILDLIVAKLAREPYEHPDAGENAAAPTPQSGAPHLASEHGALDLPALLDGMSPVRRAAIVLSTAAIFALIGARYEGDALHLAIVSGYASAFIICASTDLLAFRVPNVVTYPAIIAALVIGMTISGADRLDVALGGLVFGGLLFIPAMLAGMGMGDVKLALLVGLVLGLTLVVPAMIYMAIGGGLAAVFLLVTKVRGRRDPIPYAPFISGGALIVILAQGVAFVEL